MQVKSLTPLGSTSSHREGLSLPTVTREEAGDTEGEDLTCRVFKLSFYRLHSRSSRLALY